MAAAAALADETQRHEDYHQGKQSAYHLGLLAPLFH